MGSQSGWKERFLLRMQKEEMIVRNAINKYNLKSELLKKRGEIFVAYKLRSAVDATKEIGYRVGGDGRLYFSYTAMNTGQMLRVLKYNIKRLETFQKQHDNAVATLERMSRSIPVDFSVDSEWKIKEEGNLFRCLERFAQTIKANQAQLSAFLTALLKNGNASGLPKKRMVWIISAKFHTLPSGVVFVPLDGDFDSIRKHLLLPHQ
ncbi:hypothetical protein ERJ75_001710500 [Trypanosoma vivax]|nr:hypothetical protein ERJ75_001710500 [Trypanosoma vivax]